VPGGGFTGGDKAGYGALGAWFARNGVSTAVINYRLAPDHPWPSGAQDVGAAVDWLGGELGSFGRQTWSVVLWGQSAGAAHVASYLAGHGRGGKAPEGVAEAMLMSGFYEMTPEHRAPNLMQYFGSDPGCYAERSPINGIDASEVPVSVWVAEYDPPFLATPSLDMARRLTLRDGRCPPTFWLAGHNHVSTVLAIGSPADDVGPQVLERIWRLD
jgi:triacylglycerol lipase